MRRSASSTTLAAAAWHVVVEAAHADRGRRRHEAVAARDVAGAMPSTSKRHDLRLLGLGPEGAEDRLQRAHPAQRARLGRRRPSASTSARGSSRMMPGTISAMTSGAAGRASRRWRRRTRPSWGRTGSSPARCRSARRSSGSPAIASSGAPTRGPFFSSRTSAGAPAGRRHVARAGAASRRRARPHRGSRARPARR